MYKKNQKYMNHDIHPGINVSSSKSMYVLTLKSMCISVTGVKLWNSLDNSLISCKNVHHFKKCYTDRLLNSYVLDHFCQHKLDNKIKHSVCLLLQKIQ